MGQAFQNHACKLMRKNGKPPPPIVRRTARGLDPVSQYDAEEIATHAIGTEFDLVARTARSKPQQGAYWKALTLAVDTTGLWPTREALHTALKVSLGRVEPIYDMKGRVCGMRPDSTAFDAMPHREFCIYLEQAMAVLAEAIGYDPLKFMEA